MFDFEQTTKLKRPQGKGDFMAFLRVLRDFAIGIASGIVVLLMAKWFE